MKDQLRCGDVVSVFTVHDEYSVGPVSRIWLSRIGMLVSSISLPLSRWSVKCVKVEVNGAWYYLEECNL
jgi:hypothetical protein